jgi:diguanylate cyclase (GGDEF)-like protein
VPDQRPALAAAGRETPSARDAAAWARILNAGNLPTVLAGCVVFVGVVAVVNSRTSFTISGYLLAVSVAAWRGGIPGGVMMSLLAATGQLCADLYGEDRLSSGYAVADAFSRLVAYVFLSVLINALRRLLARERTYAYTDPLTGLANRRGFEETARVELDRARRYSRPLSAAFIDVDEFKRINDISGHAVGDDVLHTIGVELRSGLRSSDVAARVGGDEFVLLLPESPPNAAEAALARVQKRLHDELSAGAVHASVSIGMVTFLRPPETVQSLFASSDKVMYAAKRAKSGGLHVVLDSTYPTEPPIPPSRAGPGSRT